MSDNPASTSDSASAAQEIPQQHSRPQDDLPNPTPVEMTSFTSKAATSDPDRTAPPAPSSPANNYQHQPHQPHESVPPPGPMRTDTHTALTQSSNPPPPPPANTLPAPVARTFSTAIGPSTDTPVLPPKDTPEEPAGPTLLITLLLTSGARHPFRLDAKYLQKRNVDVPQNDPFNLSVYKLKELILREWRDEWEAKPSSPSYIRLISFGKLLDDKAPLKDSRFAHDSPNVIHMTIKPQDYVEEEDAKGAKSSYGGASEAQTRSPGCRCVIM